MLSTMPLKRTARIGRHLKAGLSLLGLAFLSSCVTPPLHHLSPPSVTTGTFVMSDKTTIPYRAWLPDKDPTAVVLALHGMNDSRDAWEYPAPDFTTAGIALYSPDLRGFGGTDTARPLSSYSPDSYGREHGCGGADGDGDGA
jgi:hypothetical protein